MQSKSGPSTQNSVVAERARLAQDRGWYYWKCRQRDRASNFREWLPVETHDGRCTCSKHIQTHIDRKQEVACASAHTQADTHAILIILWFLQLNLEELLIQNECMKEKKGRRIDYLRAKQLSVLKERPNSLRRATSECLRQRKPFPGSPKLVSKLPVCMHVCVRACTQADI